MKNKKCSHPEYFISKYRQRSFKCEHFNYKRTLSFELRTVELAILFYWFLNRSPQLKADENSTKVPISSTNFSNKVPISESYHKNVTFPWSFKLLCPLTIKWGSFQFWAKFANIKYLHLLRCLPHAKYNKAVGNSGFKAVLSILKKIWKKPVMFRSEKDISCYIFQKISRKKLILIHEKTPDIITYRWQYY